jgi:hypothetical protein
MSRLAALLVLFAGVIGPATVEAGEIIGFQPGRPAAPVLPHTKLRAVVAEFLDPGNTGLGKALGYLVWREILTAIADQAGAGVILAHAPGNRRLVDMLQERYHESAIEAAKGQAARMALWGVVEEHDARLFVGTYLSILPDASQAELMLRLVGTPPLGADVSAEIPRTRLNFPLVETTRDTMFRRRVITKTGAVVLDAADRGGRVVAKPTVGTALDAEDIVDGWFKVRLAGGRTGYIRNDLVELPPRTVEIAARAVALRAAPGGAARPPSNLSGGYPVLNMRYVGGSGLWYEIDAGTARGWLPASQARARFSLPAVHFIAGLYRYQLGRYDDARREFEQYLAARDVESDNTSLAMGYQLLGASQLLGKDVYALRGRSDAIDAFSNAIALTPWDPAAYNLRAVAVLALKGRLLEALPDLEKAVELDADNARTRALIALMVTVATTGQPMGIRQLVSDAQHPTVREGLGRVKRQLEAAGRPLR